MASALTATVMVCVPALPPIDATIGISTASATICSMVASNRLITAEARIAVTRLASSQVKRSRVVCHTESLTNSPATPPMRRDVFGRLLLHHLDHVVGGDHPDQPAVGVDHRRRGEIVALELARHLLLVGFCQDRMDVAVGDGLDRRRALGAKQPVERGRAEQMIGGIDHEDFVEPVGKVVGLAHEVDRLADRPERRHGDQIGLHDAAGGIVGIFEAPLKRRALERRELGENVRLVFLVEVLEQIDRIVGIELLERLGHLLGGHGLEHLVAHQLVEFGQCAAA